MLWTLKKEKDKPYSCHFQLKAKDSVAMLYQVEDKKQALSSDKEGVRKEFICEIIKKMISTAYQSTDSLKSSAAFSFFYLECKADIVDVSEAVTALIDTYKVDLGVFGYAVKPPTRLTDIARNQFAFHAVALQKQMDERREALDDQARLEKEGWVRPE